MNTTRELADIGARTALPVQKSIDDNTTMSLLNAKDRPAREAFAQAIVEEARKEQDADGAKALGMALDLNLDLQNKADMWRDEFERIKAIACSDSEIAGICDRALLDIRSKISLIDQREKVADENADLRAIMEKAIEMVNTPGTTAETLPKAINAKIMQRDEYHAATIKKLDEAQGEIQRLLKLDATNRDNLERTHQALVESQVIATQANQACERLVVERDDLRAELAKRDERLAKLEGRPVSVRPTREDGDSRGNVCAVLHTGELCIQAISHPFSDAVCAWWPFSPPPAPSPEEIERREFEAWWNSSDNFAASKPVAWHAWQARAAKEGKSV